MNAVAAPREPQAMTVGIITTSFPRYPGDPAGCFVEAHARWLQTRGELPTVVAATDPARPRQQSDLNVVDVASPSGLFYRGGAAEALEVKGKWFSGLRFSHNLHTTVKTLAPNWSGIYAHWLVPCALAAVRCRRPTVAIAHAGDVRLLNHLRLTGVVARQLRRDHLRLVFVSESVKQRFVQPLPKKLARHFVDSIVCPMGIDVKAMQDPGATRSALSLPKTFVLFLGRLVDIKSIDQLVAAARHLPEDVHVVIAGDGPVRGQLLAQARRIGCHHRVHFVGEVSGRDKQSCLQSAQALVLPTATQTPEGFPTTILESMATGLTVITTLSGGCASLPPDCVISLPDNAPQTIASAIMTTLSANQAQSLARSQRAARYAQQFDWGCVGSILERELGRAQANAG